MDDNHLSSFAINAINAKRSARIYREKKTKHKYKKQTKYEIYLDHKRAIPYNHWLAISFYRVM